MSRPRMSIVSDRPISALRRGLWRRHRSGAISSERSTLAVRELRAATMGSWAAVNGPLSPVTAGPRAPTPTVNCGPPIGSCAWNWRRSTISAASRSVRAKSRASWAVKISCSRSNPPLVVSAGLRNRATALTVMSQRCQPRSRRRSARCWSFDVSSVLGVVQARRCDFSGPAGSDHRTGPVSRCHSIQPRQGRKRHPAQLPQADHQA